jgi:serine/threonine protein kinase
MKWFGSEGDYRVLVIDRLGASLQELFVECDHMFLLKTVLMLAEQLLTRFEYLHARGYTHGSVKPANFTMGFSPHVRSCCYMIDFGRSKKYISTKGVHIDVNSYAST